MSVLTQCTYNLPFTQIDLFALQFHTEDQDKINNYKSLLGLLWVGFDPETSG